MSGTLYLVATPIGNLEDMTFRGVRILKEVDLIAAEDTRNSIHLLNHFEISTPMTSYHEYNKYDKAEILIQKLLEGKNIAVITDAGTPGISDPGEVLVQKCYENGIPVTPVPGAAACISALVASGQPAERFVFEAFLPQDHGKRKEILSELKEETRTIVLYEAPHRLKKTLSELTEVLGENRELTICRELTKKHETFRQKTLKEALEMVEEEKPLGEYVLVIHGKPYEEIRQEEREVWRGISVEDQIRQYLKAGDTMKEAVKKTASDRGVPKREIYQISISMKDE